MRVDPRELAWAAGFFDGEGCTSVSKVWGAQRTPVPRISIAQTDPRPLERFHRAVGGLGNIRTFAPADARHSRQWVLHASGWRVTQAIIALLWSSLSEPKREQARKALLVGRSGPARDAKRSHCKRGHPLVGDNLRIERSKHGAGGIGRRCRQCARNRDRERRQRRSASGL